MMNRTSLSVWGIISWGPKVFAKNIYHVNRNSSTHPGLCSQVSYSSLSAANPLDGVIGGLDVKEGLFHLKVGAVDSLETGSRMQRDVHSTTSARGIEGFRSKIGGTPS